METKKNRHFFTRKNLIVFSLVALFSILLVFVAICIDRSEMALVSEKNPIAMLANGLFGGHLIAADMPGIISVTLIGLYAIIFAVAFVFERRYCTINNRSKWSKKMILIYIATLVACLALSLGLGLLIQPKISAEDTRNLLIYVGESLAIALILYIGFGAIVVSICMLIVNFRKVNKPFEFFEDNTLDEILSLEEKAVASVSDSFDEPQETQPQANSGFGGGIAGGVAEGSAAVGAVPSGVRELEERDRVFPALSALDEQYEGYVAEKLESDDVSLQQLCEGFRNYLAKHEHLYYDIATIRMFISGLNATRILLLEGLSGTGKSSLPRYFAKYVQGKATFLAVQATWRDRSNLLGYFNDFSKTYAETDFLSAMYEANYDTDRINMFVLDELNISRVEYYFADFLSVLEYPEEEWKLRVMQFPLGFLPPVKLEDGYIRIPANSYFVGTANKDDSTFSIADKVYDRSIPIEFDNRNEYFEVEGNAEPITLGMSKLKSLFTEAEENTAAAFTADDFKKYSQITDYIYDEFDVAFGNRVLNQIEALVPTYIACGGTKEEVLDFILARKVLIKLEGRFEDYIKDGLKELNTLLANVYGAGTFKLSEKLIASFMKKL